MNQLIGGFYKRWEIGTERVSPQGHVGKRSIESDGSEEGLIKCLACDHQEQ